MELRPAKPASTGLAEERRRRGGIAGTSEESPGFGNVLREDLALCERRHPLFLRAVGVELRLPHVVLEVVEVAQGVTRSEPHSAADQPDLHPASVRGAGRLRQAGPALALRSYEKLTLKGDFES